MKALTRKLLRDLNRMRGQAVAIAMVLAAGVAMFVMSLTMLASLQRTMDRYYEQYRFAHVFAHLKRAPNALGGRISEIPGVGIAQTRIVVDVTLDVPDLPEPASARIISIPDRGRPSLNGIHLRRGRWAEPALWGSGGPADRAEVLISESFAEAHNLLPGAVIRAIINERLRELTVVGIALSPEYIYEIREFDIFPDPLRFGVFWMPETDLAAAFGMEGAFNSIALALSPGAIEADVIARLDELTAPYGGLGAIGRDDQTSHRFVSGEIEELRAMALIAPVIFLGVAAFLLNMVITRLVQTQREQIALLKAFGYARGDIAEHYLSLVGVIVLVGSIIGIIAGSWLGHGMTALYARFFRFPHFEYSLDPRIILPALFVASAAAFIGTFAAVRRSAKLPPAEAMRPEPPADFRPTLVERLGLQRICSQPARMVLRYIERQPLRAGMAIFGIAMAVAILLMGSFMEDAIDELMDHQFVRSQRHDVTINFFEPCSGSALKEAQLLPGAIRAEPFRTVPARLRHEHRARLVAITGLPAQRQLQRLIDRHNREIELPREGLLLSTELANALGVRIGDVVRVEVLEGERPERDVAVAALIDDYIGMWAYMHLDAVHALMREQDAISGAYLLADVRRVNEMYRQIKETPRVAGVMVKAGVVQAFRETVAENLLIMRTFNIMFACIIAFGVVYNTARISLAERARELATLRVIGFRRAEVSAIMLGELGTLTLTAIPFGLALGYGFAALMAYAVSGEDFRLPLVIQPRTYAFAASVTIIAAAISGLIVRRRIDRFDLVSVLKAPE